MDRSAAATREPRHPISRMERLTAILSLGTLGFNIWWWWPETASVTGQMLGNVPRSPSILATVIAGTAIIMTTLLGLAYGLLLGRAASEQSDARSLFFTIGLGLAMGLVPLVMFIGIGAFIASI